MGAGRAGIEPLHLPGAGHDGPGLAIGRGLGQEGVRRCAVPDPATRTAASLRARRHRLLRTRYSNWDRERLRAYGFAAEILDLYETKEVSGVEVRDLICSDRFWEHLLPAGAVEGVCRVLAAEPERFDLYGGGPDRRPARIFSEPPRS